MTGAQLPGGQQLPGEIATFRLAEASARLRPRRMEHQRKAVHAVAQAGRLRTVVEDVAEMAAAAAAVHFGAQSCRRCGPRWCRPRSRAAGRSSASRCRSRTWSRRRTAAGRSRRRRRCPCDAPSAAGSSPGARCPPCAGSHIAAASAARAIRRRSSRSRISRRPWPAKPCSQRKAARPNRLATEASRIRRSIMMVSVTCD